MAVLAGRGPGLTPAGDDVLAGLLLVLAIAGHDRAELERAAASARTHAISRAFLLWAARGQPVAPVHHLLAALVDGDGVAIERHRSAVAALGQTSGADLLLGLRLGLGALAAGGGAGVRSERPQCQPDGLGGRLAGVAPAMRAVGAEVERVALLQHEALAVDVQLEHALDDQHQLLARVLHRADGRCWRRAAPPTPRRP